LAEPIAFCALAQMMRELHQRILPPLIHCDNQGALALAQNHVHHQRAKHIDIRYHFIRHAVQTKQATIIYIPTKDQIADILTKALGPREHYENVNKFFKI
jgi:hypothetical protein